MQRIHGLVIEASPPLPGAMAVRGHRAPDVAISVVPSLPAPTQPVSLRYQTPRQSDGSSTLRILDDAAGITHFVYSDGTLIAVDTRGVPVNILAVIAPGQTLDDLAVYLVGPVLGFVLRRLGILALHASAVDVSGAALLLIGASGSGKSTTAAALAQRGHRFLSDDLTALTFGALHIEACLAFDHLRLWPESEELLLGERGILERITPSWEKLRFTSDAAEYPVRLGALVLLDWSDTAVTSELVPPSEALLSLAAHSYSNYTLTPPDKAVELTQLGELVRCVSTFRVVRPRRGAQLADFCELLVGLAA